MPSSSAASEPRVRPGRPALARLAGWGLLLPPVLVLLVFFVAPILYLLVVSFLEPSQTELFGRRATLENYTRVLGDEFYLRIIRRTLLAGALISGIALLIGYPTAMAINRLGPRLRILCLMLLLFPLMVSNVVRAYGWISILGRRGVVNTALGDAGLIEAPLDLLYSLDAVVLGLMTILLPYMIISIANTLAMIDRHYQEAAQALGAGPIRTFLHVTLPLSTPGIASGFLLVLFLSLSAYVTISLLGGARFKLLVSLVYDQVTAFQWPRAAALSFILLAIALAAAALVLAVLRPNRVQGLGR